LLRIGCKLFQGLSKKLSLKKEIWNKKDEDYSNYKITAWSVIKLSIEVNFRNKASNEIKISNN
jgi:hypothetical protein